MRPSIIDVAEKTFDYVVVGAGVAGLTLAARLAEDPSVTVVVLEAGPENLDDPLIMIPGQYGHSLNNPKYDWCFNTTPQPFANSRSFPWNRGRTLGGSSAVNFHVWSKPPAVDVDAWEELGNPGWNWERFQTYSKRSESFTAPSPELQARYRLSYEPSSHGYNGTVKTMFPSLLMAGEVQIQETLHALGINNARNPFGGDPIGTFMSVTPVDPEKHTRSYAVTIVTRRVESGEENSTIEATGVKFAHSGAVHTVHARKEVILCAGALKSPQILELSGIGDRQVLEPLGIETKIDLPGVGSNVQEHEFCCTIFELDPKYGFETLDMLHDKTYAAQHLKLHAEGKGLYTLGLGTFAFIPLVAVTSKPEEAHALISAQRSHIEAQIKGGKLVPGLAEQYTIQLERLESGNGGECEIISFPQRFGPPGEPGKAYVSIIGAVNHPFARGTIHITSTDPDDQSEMDPHYFEHEFDLSLFTELMKFIRRFQSTEPFKSMIVEEVVPGSSVITDDDVKKFIKDSMGTIYHTVGSAAMLPRDKNGVVNGDLQVYGTTNIRIADLSIIPLHVSAHTQASAYMIGEIAADILLKKL